MTAETVALSRKDGPWRNSQVLVWVKRFNIHHNDFLADKNHKFA